jgi:hypothetical protein
MALIGNLAIGITANASGFASGINKALAVLNGFKSAVTSTAGKIAGITTGLAGVAGAAGAGMLVSQQMEAVDSAAKLADKLGMDIQQLRGLQYAAGLAGGSAESFSNALTKMNQNVGDAIAGTKTAQAAFNNLGINVQDAAKSGAGDLFKQVADKIKDLPTPAQRASAAMDIFGKSYTDIMTFIETGSADMDSMIDRFNMLSGSLDRVDAAKIEAANDRLSDMKIILEGVAAKIGVEVAPYIDAMINKFVDMGFTGQGAAQHIVNGVSWITQAIAEASDYLYLFESVWYGLQAGITYAIRGIIQPVKELGDALVYLASLAGYEMANPVKEFADGLVIEAEAAWGKAMDAADKFNAGTNSQKAGQWFAEVKTNAQAAAVAISQAAEKKRDLMGGATMQDGGLLERMKELGKLAKKMFEDTRTPMEKFKTQMLDAGEAFMAGLTDMETFDRYAKMLQKTLFPDKKAEQRKVGSFASIDNSRFALATSSQKNQTQKVSDPQLEQTNQLLRQIKANLGQTVVAQ